MSEATKQIVITGANKGIGRATVAAILDEHPEAFVFLGSRSRARGEAARETLLQEHPGWADRLVVVALDVADEASVEAAAATVAGHLGERRLYGLVNNAGIGLGDTAMREVLEVNTWGPKRVIDAFLPLLEPEGRIVNVSSASGPMFVARCDEARAALLTKPDVTWSEVEALMRECLRIEEEGGDLAAAGLATSSTGSGQAYGLSKACLNAYTIALARENPDLTVNACTPGYIATDLTLPRAEGVDPASMGMKPPEEGTKATMHLLFGDPGGSGWYFGSDAQRSPLDRYRSPGDPPFTG